MKIRNEKMSAAKAAKRVLDLEEEDHNVNRTPPKKRKQTLVLKILKNFFL
jgi:hypothetical protein